MKTYSISRKINLAKYGLNYETIDFCVEGCESFEEARKEIKEQIAALDMSFKELNKKKELNEVPFK